VLHRTVAFNHSRRLASTYTDKPFFLTCPIFYVNSKPHLGHAYTTCLADSWARYAHLRNQAVLKPFQQDYTASSYSSVFDYCSSNKTFLSCGTDEHGSKVRRAATANKFDPLQYCNHMSPLFKTLCHATHVKCNDFIRTTETRHSKAVCEFWKRLETSGHLYRSKYSGWYCISDEAFYMPWEVSETSVSGVPIAKETGNPVEWIEEENYMFKALSHFFRLQIVFSKSSSQSVWGDIAHNIVDTAQDVSISRPKCRLDWGIQVPVDDKQIIYVWLDALVSYLTVAGFPWSTDDSSKQILWPPDIQFFGKDIIRFHAVLWPALLMAVDLPLPRRLICHHHVLVDDVKMSKSRGNHIDPISEQCALFAEELNNITPGESDVLRYVLLRLPLLTSDSTYSREMARQMINTELVNWIGNLLSRITSESLNPEQSIIQINRNEVNDMFHHDNLDTDFFNSLDNISYHFDKLWWYKAQPHNAIEEVLRVVRQTNAFITRHSPWSEQEPLRRQAVISVVAESLRVCALLMYPVVPNLSHRLLNRLGIHNKESQLSSQLDGARVLGENTGKFLRKL
ncbi:Methionine--tRNA ligase, partial [Schistosoma japonicum]